MHEIKNKFRTHKKAWLSFLLSLFIPFVTLAQTDQADMADAMRSNGKIYVVVLVIATIFVGIIAFLIYLDKKISRLEKQSRLSKNP